MQYLLVHEQTQGIIWIANNRLYLLQKLCDCEINEGCGGTDEMHYGQVNSTARTYERHWYVERVLPSSELPALYLIIWFTKGLFRHGQ